MKAINIPSQKLFWFTGQPGSGKTSLAILLKEKLNRLFGIRERVVILDGDEIRAIFNNTDYSLDGRMKNVEIVQNCCRFLLQNDIITIVCMVSPFAEQRSQIIKEFNGCEILVECSEPRGRENFYVEYFEKPKCTDDYKSIIVNTSFKNEQESFEVLWKKLF